MATSSAAIAGAAARCSIISKARPTPGHVPNRCHSAPKRSSWSKRFADQAVIAIENVRLFDELNEALEQQTATSDILRILSSSLTDAQPVFDTIAKSAARLCKAQFCLVFRFDGEL